MHTPFTPPMASPDGHVWQMSCPGWGLAMDRAARAHQAGLPLTAVAHCETALALAQRVVHEQPDAPGVALAVAALQAWVCTQVCLSEWLAEDGQLNGAAKGLAAVHGEVLAWLQRYGHADQRHAAAAVCVRQTHAALVALWATHGPHPHIDRAIRAGCLRVRFSTQWH